MPEKEDNGFRKALKRRLVVLTVFTLSFILVLSLFWILRKKEISRLNSEFSLVSTGYFDFIEDRIGQNILALESVKRFFIASANMDRGKFKKFTKGFLSQGRNNNLFFSPRVKDQQRTLFKETAQQDGYAAFQITENDARGLLQKAGSRSEYFPVYYIEPWENYKDAFGFDLSFIAGIKKILFQACENNAVRLYAGPPAPFIKGYYAFLPLYRGNLPGGNTQERRDNLSGFIGISFSIEGIVSLAMKKMPEQQIKIYLYERPENDPHAAPALLYSQPLYRQQEDNILIQALKVINFTPVFRIEKVLSAGANRWFFVFESTPGFSFSQQRYFSIFFLLCGSPIAFLFAFYVHTLLGRSQIVQTLVEERTRQLRQIEERFRGLVENLKEEYFFYTQDTNGVFTYVSPSIKNIMGYSSAEFTAHHSKYMSTSPINREAVEHAKLTLQGIVQQPYVAEISHKNSSVRLIEMRETPVFGNDGKVTAVQGIARDITEQERAKEELRRAYKQLEDTHIKLVQTAKMASVGSLASGVAHEINNPLTGVLNNIQLIKILVEKDEKFDINNFRELIEIVEKSAKRCAKITQSLLNFSRASTGAFKKLSLNEIIENVTSLIEHEMNLRNIVIEKKLQAGLPEISGDPQLMQQVIYDIIDNARWATLMKSAIQKTGLIRISTAYIPLDKYIHVYISDNGIGISKKDMQKIFEPFFTTKPTGEGTGLGLSIAYNIIRQHKGTIEAESRESEGATFKIALPVPKEE